jgi:hypothetical protein
MKKAFLNIFVLFSCLLLTGQLFGQTVQVCIGVNGSPMPVSKMYKMCKKTSLAIPGLGASTVTLSLTNCAAVPQSNVTYKWKNLSIAPFTDSLHSVITVKDTGKWEATIIDNVTLLSYTDTLHLVYYPLISVVMTASYANTCPLTPGYLTTTVTGPVATYAWYEIPPSSLIPGETSSSYTFYTKNRSYAVVVKDVNNCANADSSIYFAQAAAIKAPKLGPDPAPICEDIPSYNITDTATYGYDLSGGSGYVYYGINSTIKGSFVISGPSPQHGPPPPVNIKSFLAVGTNTYWMRISKFGLCDNADSIVITVNPIPVVNLGPTDVITACYGNNTTLTSTILVGTAPYTYAWSPGGGATPSIVISPTSPTTYIVSVTDVNGCTPGTDTILVNVTPEILFTISPDVTICRYPLDSTTLSVTTPVTGGTGPYTYAWSPTTGLSPTKITTTSITAAPIVTTPYTLTVKDNMSCTNTRTVNVTSYKPAISISSSSNFSANPPYIINETHPTTLTISTASGNLVEWKNGKNNTSLNTTSSLALEYSGPDTTNYVAVVTDPAAPGCINYDTIEVWSISENTLLYVPNIFSPNATNPENQKFRIYGDNLAPDNFKILVYNKWGNLVYESTDLVDTKTNGWDGGSKIEGVYTYVIVGKFKNGKDVNESKFNKGTFSLIK